MTKRFAVLMFFGFFAICAFSNKALGATDWTVSLSTQFTSAIADSVSGDTITLTSDIIITAVNTVSNKSLTIKSDGIFRGLSGEGEGGFVFQGGPYLIDGISFNNMKSAINSENAIVTIGDGVIFSSNTASQNGGGIYNHKGSTMTIGDRVIFSSNTANKNGGAIDNIEASVIKIGNGSIFSLNRAYKWGGAINNTDKAVLTIADGAVFSSNTAGEYGGAIDNYQSALMSIGDSAAFLSNSSNNGGAISNETSSKFEIGEGAVFSSNSASTGGGIYNSNSSVMTIGEGAVFSSNSASTGGGIYNNSSSMIIGEGAVFSSNSASAGGGIYNNNSSVMTIGDGVIFSSNTASKNGGAIYNTGNSVMTIADGAFFSSNTASENGGAIYNMKATLNLVAENADIEFTENRANGVSNAIYDSAGTINMQASDSASIMFNDRIISQDNKSVININRSSDTLPTSGKVILNEDMTGYTGEVNLYNGTVALGENGTLFGGKIVVYGDKATIDFTNGKIQEHNFKDLTVNDNLNLIAEADLENKKMDTIASESDLDTGEINIKTINILSDAKNTTEIMFTSSTALKDKINANSTAMSAYYKYTVAYDKQTGYFSFTNAGRIKNSAVLAGAAASAAGGLTTQKVIADQAFASFNNFLSKKIKQTQESGINKNLYASTTNQVFEPKSKIERSLWIRPYASRDTVKLEKADIDNTLYGTLAGADLPISQDKQVSVYIGYSGGKQDFEDIKINQTGYIIGASGMLIKEKWYAAITANINFNKAEADTLFGTDEFDMNMYAIAAKAGYDIEAGKNWTIEPNLTLLYGSVNRDGYTTKQGAKIKAESDSNIIMAPQVKAKLELKNGLMPYGLLGYIINAGDKIKTQTDGMQIDTEKIDGYVEYGAGLNKEFINTPWSCYVQITGNAGDRNGFDGRLGIKYGF